MSRSIFHFTHSPFRPLCTHAFSSVLLKLGLVGFFLSQSAYPDGGSSPTSVVEEPTLWTTTTGILTCANGLRTIPEVDSIVMGVASQALPPWGRSLLEIVNKLGPSFSLIHLLHSELTRRSIALELQELDMRIPDELKSFLLKFKNLPFKDRLGFVRGVIFRIRVEVEVKSREGTRNILLPLGMGETTHSWLLDRDNQLMLTHFEALLFARLSHQGQQVFDEVTRPFTDEQQSRLQIYLPQVPSHGILISPWTGTPTYDRGSLEVFARGLNSIPDRNGFEIWLQSLAGNPDLRRTVEEDSSLWIVLSTRETRAWDAHFEQEFVQNSDRLWTETQAWAGVILSSGTDLEHTLSAITRQAEDYWRSTSSEAVCAAIVQAVLNTLGVNFLLPSSTSNLVAGTLVDTAKALGFGGPTQMPLQLILDSLTNQITGSLPFLQTLVQAPTSNSSGT